jgi:hypothetical protein
MGKIESRLIPFWCLYFFNNFNIHCKDFTKYEFYAKSHFSASDQMLKLLLFWICKCSIIYFIRHGEKQPNSKLLSAKGTERAECIARLFTDKYPSPKRIIAQPPRGKYLSQRPLATVLPLAHALNLEIDTECLGNDFMCIQTKLSLDIPTLVSWQHKRMSVIVANLIGQEITYPKKDFDWIWIVNTKTKVLRKVRQDCTFLYS